MYENVTVTSLNFLLSTQQTSRSITGRQTFSSTKVSHVFPQLLRDILSTAS